MQCLEISLSVYPEKPVPDLVIDPDSIGTRICTESVTLFLEINQYFSHICISELKCNPPEQWNLCEVIASLGPGCGLPFIGKHMCMYRTRVCTNVFFMDACHFAPDPDPRICTTDLRIWIQILHANKK